MKGRMGQLAFESPARHWRRDAPLLQTDAFEQAECDAVSTGRRMSRQGAELVVNEALLQCPDSQQRRQNAAALQQGL